VRWRALVVARRRALVAILALAAWVAGSALGALGPGGSTKADAAGIAIGKAHADYTPSLTGSKPIVILAVGSGARPGDDVMHSLSDSLHLIFLNPTKHHATLVGIPRDSWVDIPGHGMSKVNAALGYGGPDLMVQTIESVTGVHIDYWAITTFWGFTNMINQINGLSIDVPFRMNDPSYSRANLQPGLQRLNGVQALSMARDRHSMLEGDFARSENQGRLMLAALAQFRKDYAADPGNMFTWLGAGMSNMTTTAPLNEILRLAFTASKVPPKNVQNVVLPGTTQTIGSQSTVVLNDAWKVRIFKDAKADGMLGKGNVPPSPTANQPRG
jgi:polyisoprenyl-teichoic acid--peptidoglycan teichoic acid transferase